MHLAPLLAGVEDRATLTTELMHDIWRDGIVLHAQAAALALLSPEGLAPWAIFRFSVRGTASDRVRLSPKLHGLTKASGGIVRPPALTLARGAVLVPAAQEEAVRDALDEGRSELRPHPGVARSVSQRDADSSIDASARWPCRSA